MFFYCHIKISSQQRIFNFFSFHFNYKGMIIMNEFLHPNQAKYFEFLPFVLNLVWLWLRFLFLVIFVACTLFCSSFYDMITVNIRLKRFKTNSWIWIFLEMWPSFSCWNFITVKNRKHSKKITWKLSFPQKK